MYYDTYIEALALEQWIRVGLAAALSVGSAVRVEIDDRRIALFNVDGTFRAVDDFCLHQGGPLSEGTVEHGAVECPWHRWRYDLTTGERIDRRGSSINAYPVKTEDGWIAIGLAEHAPEADSIQ